ncbi:hypothetical protein WH47_03671, partial [Habropoda laboriosa]
RTARAMKYNSAIADGGRHHSSRQRTNVGTHLMRIQWSTVVAGHGGSCATVFIPATQLVVFAEKSEQLWM